ncbi:MAG: beta-lactamase family protein [Candidatus Heimdallarchaeota archaeon]|nr:beta-lactamase family protein [Candidatus Heimdallarchaeota archaeon]
MEKEIDELFKEYSQGITPGAVIGVIKNGEMVFSKAYGYANLEYDIKLTPDSVFRLASVSKQFTAACILILEQEGKLSLDDPLSDYFPQLEYDSEIRIRHLIHHTSGIKDYLEALTVANYTEKDIDIIEEGELLKFLTKIKGVNFKPGTEFAYSNTGYFLLGQLVKILTGKSLRQFADETIFKPLGMTNTHYHDDYTEIVRNRASGYSKTEDGFSISMTNCDIVGDGAVFSTVADLAKWDQNFYHKTLGGDEFISQLQTVGPYNIPDFDYAYGLNVSEYKGLKRVSHGGGFAGFRSYMTRFPEQNLSIIVLANLAQISPDTYAYQIADLYLADYISEEIALDKSIQISPSVLENKVGEYLDKKKYFYQKVELVENNLILAGWQATLYPIDNEHFRIISPIKLDVTLQDDYFISLYSRAKKINKMDYDRSSYLGSYKNGELEQVYTIIEQDGELSIDMRGLGKPKLTNVGIDIFYALGFLFEFGRENGSVISCTIGNFRARDFTFIKIH